MAKEEKPPSEIVFHYIKSNQYRVIHADGAWGGISPRGLIQMNFYSERQPIPKQTVHTVVEGQRLGDEIVDKRVSREGPVREVEVGAIMELGAARALRDWLTDKIAELESRISPDNEGQ